MEHNKSRNIAESLKRIILEEQSYKCANHPTAQLRGLGDYKCPYWRGPNNGSFDESGYVIGHIIEYSLTRDNRKENLQALCYCCHKVKTMNFLRNKNDIDLDVVEDVVKDK